MQPFRDHAVDRAAACAGKVPPTAGAAGMEGGGAVVDADVVEDVALVQHALQLKQEGNQ